MSPTREMQIAKLCKNVNSFEMWSRAHFAKCQVIEIESDDYRISCAIVNLRPFSISFQTSIKRFSCRGLNYLYQQKCRSWCRLIRLDSSTVQRSGSRSQRCWRWEKREPWNHFNRHVCKLWAHRSLAGIMCKPSKWQGNYRLHFYVVLCQRVL